MISEVSLSVQFRVLPKILEIEYLVTNRSNANIYLVDLAAQLKAEAITIRPATIEVAVDPIKNEITLSSKMLPISSNVLYAVAPDVYTSALQPGQVKKSMFTVPLPIKLTNEKEVKPESSIIQDVIKSTQPAAAKPAAPAQRELNISKLIFVLGVISKEPGLKIEEQLIDDVAVSRMVVSEAIPHQKELKVDSIVSPAVQVIIEAPA